MFTLGERLILTFRNPIVTIKFWVPERFGQTFRKKKLSEAFNLHVVFHFPKIVILMFVVYQTAIPNYST